MYARQEGPIGTIEAGEALTAKRFIDAGGLHTVDLPALGVTLYNVDSGDQCQYQMYGEPVVEAGGTITAKDLVKSDANGKAVSAGTTWDIKVCGLAVHSAVDGGFLRVKLL